METLFEGKVLILSEADMTPGSRGKEKTFSDINFTDIKFSLKPFQKANYVLYYDERSGEMKVLKERYEIISGRGFLRHLIDVVWNHVTESEEVPATSTADKLIDKALGNESK